MSGQSDIDPAFQAFLQKFNAANPAVTPIASTDPAEIGEFVVKSAPNGSAQKWLTELMAINAPAMRKPSIGVYMLAAAGAVTGFALIYGVFFTPSFLSGMAAPGNARGLITFLFAFATIAVVIITVIAAFWVKLEEVEQRGALAKEILTILIGILGTILGFYFGQAQPEVPVAAPAEVATPSTAGGNG
jgi:hypothetical protein